MGGGRKKYSKIFGCRYWLVHDPCGIVCGFFTWMLLLYAQFCIITVMMASISEENALHQVLNFIVFEMLFMLAFASHVKTMFTDPGAVTVGTLSDQYIAHLEADTQNYGAVLYKCTKCACIRPERAHHCSVCKRCIRRMDHHCPWVNNCVGERNQKAFVLFTFYIALLSCQTLYWSIRHFISCIGEEWHFCSYFGPPVTTVLLIFLLFEAILFSIFTAVMFGTQLSSICSDQTGIESLKQERYSRSGFDLESGGEHLLNNGNNNRPSGSSWKNLQTVFGGGGPFSIQWLNPFAVPFLSEKAFEFSV